jgi:N-acetyl sugar amidotransferase
MNAEIFLDENAWKAEWQRRRSPSKKRCTRCLYDEATPSISFDAAGVCSYCHTHDQLMEQYQSVAGRQEFENIVKKIKYDGRNKKYDIIVGVSGGADSSYMIYLAKEYGLRPLAVHFDNTWNSTIAVENINNVLEKLDVELWTHVVDNHEYDDLYRAILKAGVPDLEAPTDLALAVTLNQAAIKHGIKYIFEGHSFKTEGISPLGWLYMDAKYIDSMHKQYGTLKKLHTYPYMWLSKQLKWMLFNRLKKIRPFWYIDYQKEEAKKMLAEKFGWQWYGGHHLENRITNFYHTYFIPRRFDIDGRVNGFAALVRSGQMDREEGIALLATPPQCDPEIVALVKKRWQLSDEEFIHLMTQPTRTYKEYKTYKSTFEKMRPFFYIMAKMNLIPMSFYLKYTLKDVR